MKENRLNLSYKGGHPECSKSFLALITKQGNQILFLEGNFLKEKFRINVDDILDVRYRDSDSRISKPIIITVDYNGSKIEISLSGGIFPEKNYNKLLSLIKANNAEPINIQRKRKTSIALTIVMVAVLAVAFVMAGISDKNNAAKKATQPVKTASVQKTVPENVDLQTYLRNKLNDKDIEITDSTNTTGYILIKYKCSTDTKSGLSYECYKLLNAARTRPEYKKASKIGIMITADLKDQYGNISNDKIFMQDFDKSELDKVNWTNIEQDRMYLIGEQPWYHNIVRLDK